MKKTFALLVLAILVFEGSGLALNVVVSNVVVAHQSDDQRSAYTGRLGELVANTNNFSLTVFDGDQVGGYPLRTPNQFIVAAAKDDSYAEETAAGLRLQKAVDDAAAYTIERLANSINNPAAYVLIQEGIYDMGTNTLTVRADVALQGSQPGGDKRTETSGGYATDTILPLVIIQASSNDVVVKYTDAQHIGMANEAIMILGDTEIDAYGTDVLTFSGCSFAGAVFQTVPNDSTLISATDCNFSGGTNVFGKGNLSFLRCHFAGDSVIDLAYSFNEDNDTATFRDCLFKAPNVCVATDNTIHVPPDFFRCRFIDCVSVIPNDQAYNWVGLMSMEYCTLTGGLAVDWTQSASFSADIRFSSGIPVDTVGDANFTLINCSDETGTAIVNQ